MGKKGKVLIKQIRSHAGREKTTLLTLKALGLGKIGSTREHQLNSSVAGMIRSVEHLLSVSHL